MGSLESFSSGYGEGSAFKIKAKSEAAEDGAYSNPIDTEITSLDLTYH